MGGRSNRRRAQQLGKDAPVLDADDAVGACLLLAAKAGFGGMSDAVDGHVRCCAAGEGDNGAKVGGSRALGTAGRREVCTMFWSSLLALCIGEAGGWVPLLIIWGIEKLNHA